MKPVVPKKEDGAVDWVLYEKEFVMWQEAAEIEYQCEKECGELRGVVPPPECFDSNGVFKDFTFEKFKRILSEVVTGKSGPGFPWNACGYVTNQDLVDKAPIPLYKATLEVLEYLRTGVDQPSLILRLFPKNEYLDLQKIEERGCRQVINLPLHWLIAEVVLYEGVVDFTIANHNESRLQPGMGLHDDGLASIEARVRAVEASTPGQVTLSTDVSAFDDNVNIHHQAAGVKLTARKHQFPLQSEWCLMAMRYERIILTAPYVMPWGVIYERVREGTFWLMRQVTGRYKTAQGNSEDRSIMDKIPVVLGAPKNSIRSALVMGDDDVARMSNELAQQYVSILTRNGIRVKLENLASNEWFSFCSHTFYRDGRKAIPQNFWKSVATTLGDQPSVVRFAQWLGTVRNHPDVQLGADLLWSSGWLKAAGLEDPYMVGVRDSVAQERL